MLSPYLPHQKPPMWGIDPGIVAYNASRMGLPMFKAGYAIWEGSGNKTYDLIGSNGCVLYNNPSWVSTKQGVGLKFVNANNTYGQLNNKIALPDNQSWSIEILVDLTLTNITGLWGDTYSVGEYARVLITDTGNVQLYNNDNDGNIWSAAISSAGLQHIFVVCNGRNTNNIELYINNVSKGFLSFDDSSHTIYRLGTYGSTTAGCLDANVMLFNVWEDTALTPPQVATLSADFYGLVRQPSMEELWAHVVAAALLRRGHFSSGASTRVRWY